MIKILIFGANGLLGVNMVTYLSKRYVVLSSTRKDLDLEHVSYDSLEEYIKKIFDYNMSDENKDNYIIINAAAVINRRNVPDEVFYKVNTIFPLLLDSIAHKLNIKVIFPCTGCVFEGNLSYHEENAIHTSSDIYALTKSKGEPIFGCGIRVSFIGEGSTQISFIEFIRQNKIMNGFTNHFWNGITALEYCRLVEKIIDNNLFYRGIRHFNSPDSYSKYNLAQIVNEVYSLKNTITPVEVKKCDRTLKTSYPDDQLTIKKTLKDQIKEQYDYYRSCEKL